MLSLIKTDERGISGKIHEVARCFSVNITPEKITVKNCSFFDVPNKVDAVVVEGLEIVQEGNTLVIRPKGKQESRS